MDGLRYSGSYTLIKPTTTTKHNHWIERAKKEWEKGVGEGGAVHDDDDGIIHIFAKYLPLLFLLMLMMMMTMMMLVIVSDLYYE